MKIGTNKLLVLLALIFTLSFPVSLFPSGPVSDRSLVSTATREGRLAVFDDAWSTINQRYYDRTFRGLDWETQRTTFRALALEANDAAELYAVLRRMIAALDDRHTRIFSPEEKFDWWQPRVVTTGVVVREIEAQPTVVYVEPGSAPHRAGIRVGDVIKDVNGKSVSLAINQRLSQLNGSSRSRIFASLLEGAPATSIEIRWEGKDGIVRVGQFTRYWQQRELGVRYRKKRNVAIIEIDAFTQPISLEVARLINDKLKGAQAVIIDLRNNGGGDADAMAEVASAFLPTGFDLGQFVDRAGSSFSISTRSRSILAPGRIQQTGLPLVVLAGERTSSAAEIFIAALKSARRAKIVGTETCGCVLAIRSRHILPDGGLLDVSELDYLTASGERLEKHGIKPDETVTFARRDLYSRRDPAVEFSIQLLTTSIPKLNAAIRPALPVASAASQ